MALLRPRRALVSLGKGMGLRKEGVALRASYGS